MGARSEDPPPPAGAGPADPAPGPSATRETVPEPETAQRDALRWGHVRDAVTEQLRRWHISRASLEVVAAIGGGIFVLASVAGLLDVKGWPALALVVAGGAGLVAAVGWWRSQRRWALVGAAAVVVSLVWIAVLTPGNQPATPGSARETGAGKTSELPCDAVGLGNSGYERAFVDAYKRNGEAEELGCPMNPVSELLGGVGYHQNFEGPKGRSVILATRPAEAYVLTGAPYQAFLGIAGGRADEGVNSLVKAGFPDSDVERLDGGGKVALGAGGRWEPSGLAGKNGHPWYWVPSVLWSRYDGDLDGPEGPLGYPIGWSRPSDGGIRQQFENGWMCYRADDGAVTVGSSCSE
jgi:hypothetical protein